MRAVIIAANWKMNTTPADAGELARDDRRAGRASPMSCASSARPSSASPPSATPLAGEGIGVGAQNVHHELAGAYTGEISAPMLAGLATWVILGHSERRRDFGETDALIGKKLGRAVEAGLRPILCVGEQLAEREAGRGRSRRRRRSSRAPSPATTRPCSSLRASSSPTSRSGRSGPVGTHRAPTPRRWPRRSAATLASAGWGERRRRGPGPLRRQRDEREHRRVPGRAGHRRRARRGRVAQAR